MLVGRKTLFRLLFFFMGFVGLSVLLASAYQAGLILHSSEKTARDPASVQYDDEGNPAFWDQSLQEIERIGERDPAFAGVGVRGRARAILSNATAVDARTAEATTGLKARQAMIANFSRDHFASAVSQMDRRTGERRIHLHLFKNASFNITLRQPSYHQTNGGVYEGQVDGDPSSVVYLRVMGEMMSGEIQTLIGADDPRRKRVFKIQYAGAGTGSRHYVIEEDDSERIK